MIWDNQITCKGTCKNEKNDHSCHDHTDGSEPSVRLGLRQGTGGGEGDPGSHRLRGTADTLRYRDPDGRGRGGTLLRHRHHRPAGGRGEVRRGSQAALPAEGLGDPLRHGGISRAPVRRDGRQQQRGVPGGHERPRVPGLQLQSHGERALRRSVCQRPGDHAGGRTHLVPGREL